MIGSGDVSPPFISKISTRNASTLNACIAGGATAQHHDVTGNPQTHRQFHDTSPSISPGVATPLLVVWIPLLVQS